MLDINPDKEVDCVSHFFISDTIPIFEGSILEKHKNLVTHSQYIFQLVLLINQYILGVCLSCARYLTKNKNKLLFIHL